MLDEIRIPIGPMFFRGFMKAINQDSIYKPGKMVMGFITEKGYALIVIKPSRYSKRRIILARRKITQGIE